MVESALSRVPLFAALPAAALVDLSARLHRPRRYRKGDVVFYQGDPGAYLCVVERGRIKLGVTSPEGREIIIDLLGPGEVFGELALLDGEPRSLDATAIEDSELRLLDREDFRRYLLDRPLLALELLSVLSRRIRRDTRLLEDAAFLDVPARLARTILRLAEAPPEGGPAITPRLNQTDLAGLVGTTRETLNHWLGFFRDLGCITLERGRITILDADRLRQRAA